MSASQATIRLKTLGGQWVTLGAREWAGIWPEGIVLSANKWGPDTAAFTLRRSPIVPHPDLAAWTPCEIEIAGDVVWRGRVAQTPGQSGADFAIHVTGKGWQHHLDDDCYERWYHHDRLSDWRDHRSFLTANLTTHQAALRADVSEGAIVLGWGNQTDIINGSRAAVTIDLGPVSTAKRIVVDWDGLNITNDFQFVCRGTDAEDATGSGENVIAITAGAGGFGNNRVDAGTFATARRYVHLYLTRTSNNFNSGASEFLIKIKAVKVFADTAYEAGNASVLKSSQVLRDALTRATDLLSSDWSEIQDTTFSIDGSLGWFEDKTPREVWEQILAPLEDRVCMIDVHARPVFKAKPTAPLFEIGAWSGADFRDAAESSGEDVFNWVIVRGQDGASRPVRVARQSAGDTIVDRQGFARTNRYSYRGTLTQAIGERVGDLFLASHKTQPFGGDFTAVGLGGVRRVLGGTAVHPAHLLTQTNQLVRCSDRIDPDTGGHGRDGTIAAVTYKHDQLTADVSLDSDRGGFERLLNRSALIAGTA